MTFDPESDRILLVVNNWPSPEIWAYDSTANAWTSAERALLRGSSHLASAYDSKSDRVILVADGTPSGSETWAYDYNSNTWTNMTTSTPTYLWGTMTYDSESDRVIYLGTHWLLPTNDEYRLETWAYDLNTNAWTEMTPASGPAGGGPMAYDMGSDRIILHQEWPGSPKTWAYDFNSNSWADVTPLYGPTSGGLMVYDSESDRTILFAGIGGYSPPPPAETWSYDYETRTWTNVTSGSEPPKEFIGAMAYDSESDLVILFGGKWGQSTTWSYDHNTNRWEGVIMEPPWSGAMAYDSGSDRIVMLADGTWAYTTETNTWTEMKPLEAPTYGLLAYDSESDRVVSIGNGPAGSWEPYPQTWAYDFETNTWRNMTASEGPPRTDVGRVTYDSESDRIILFGSRTGVEGELGPSGGRVGETWAYDFNTNTWTNMTASSGPSIRLAHQMVYDSQSDRVILFGGGDFPARNSASAWAVHAQAAIGQAIRPLWHDRTPDYNAETWAYDFNTNTWTNMTTSSGPGERGYHAMVYDPDDDRTILYGGVGLYLGSIPYSCCDDYSYLDDTWAYNFDTNTWTNMSPSTGPGQRFDAAMAYDAESHLTILFGGFGGGSPGPWMYQFALPETTRPSVAILSPSDGTTIPSRSVSVSGIASDDTAILKVELSLDGAEWTKAAGTMSWTGRLELAEGGNSIYARATDTFGNSETVRISVTVLTELSIVGVLTSPVVVAASLIGASLVAVAYLARKWKSKPEK